MDYILLHYNTMHVLYNNVLQKRIYLNGLHRRVWAVWIPDHWRV